MFLHSSSADKIMILTMPQEDFALLEVGFVTVRILQKFRGLELDSRDKKIPVGVENQDVTLTLASTDGCRVVATREVF